MGLCEIVVGDESQERLMVADVQYCLRLVSANGVSSPELGLQRLISEK